MRGVVAVARDEAARADKEESRLHQRRKYSDGRAPHLRHDVRSDV